MAFFVEEIVRVVTGVVASRLLHGVLKDNITDLATKMQVLHFKKTCITNQSPLIVKLWLERVRQNEDDADSIIDWRMVHEASQVNPNASIAQIIGEQHPAENIVKQKYKNMRAHFILQRTLTLIEESTDCIALGALAGPAEEGTNETTEEETNHVMGDRMTHIQETDNIRGHETNNRRWYDEMDRMREGETDHVMGGETSNMREGETDPVMRDHMTHIQETNNVRGHETNNIKRYDEMDRMRGDNEMNNVRGDGMHNVFVELLNSDVQSVEVNGVSGRAHNVSVELPNSEVQRAEVNGVPERARQNLQAQGLSVGGVGNNFGTVSVVNNTYYGGRRPKRPRTSISRQ